MSLIMKILVIGLLMASFVFPPELLGAEVTKRVVFPKGKTTVSYTGHLSRDFTLYDSYYFRAKKGQTLTVKLTTVEPDAIFAIYETKVLGPDEDTVVGNDRKLREWSGKLPVNGEYSVQVYDISVVDENPSGAAYTISITLR